MIEPTNTKMLKSLINEVESLRLQRQKEYRRFLHPQLKTFSQQELNDAAYPSYKNYLVGRTQKMLPREAILSISQYLECTVEQTNNLLICAGYIPFNDEPTDLLLDRLLEEGRATLRSLPFSAVLSTRDWRVHDMNDLYKLLWNVPT